MKNLPFLKIINFILVPSLLLVSVCCYSSRTLSIAEADPEDVLVVKDIDGTTYQLPQWTVDAENNIMGSGTVFSPGTVTVEEILINETTVIGEPFRGTVSPSRVAETYVRHFYASGGITFLAVLLGIIGIAAFAFAIALAVGGGM